MRCCHVTVLKKLTHSCRSTSATEDFFDVLEELSGEFESTFSDGNEHEEIFNFIENPFHMDVSSLTPTVIQLCPSNHAAMESEIVELQTNNIP